MASAAAASHLRAALDAENFGVDGANAGAPSASDTADRVEAAARTELTTAALEAADSIAALHTFLTEQASPQVAGLQEQARNMDTQLASLSSQAATKATTVEELSKLAGKVGSVYASRDGYFHADGTPCSPPDRVPPGYVVHGAVSGVPVPHS